MKKVMLMCGTRSETIVCVTGQHREMLTGMRDVLKGGGALPTETYGLSHSCGGLLVKPPTTI